MKQLFKRWREVSEQEEFSVGVVAVEERPYVGKHLGPTPDRELTQHEGVDSLEGERWTVHAANGTVYLSGENGAVQAQFAPVDAYSLGVLMQYHAQEDEQR